MGGKAGGGEGSAPSTGTSADIWVSAIKGGSQVMNAAMDAGAQNQNTAVMQQDTAAKARIGLEQKKKERLQEALRNQQSSQPFRLGRGV